MGLLSGFGNGDVLLWMIEFFLFVVWFWILIVIFGDIFRDHEMSGGAKALWIIFVIVVPFLGILIYLIARGSGMSERAAKSAREAQTQYQAQVDSTVGSAGNATDQIAKAKELLDAGAISQVEYDHLKSKALGK